MGLFSRLFGGNKVSSSGMRHYHVHTGSLHTSSKDTSHEMEYTINQPSSGATSTTVKDPVCNMDVNPEKAEAKSEYLGQIYYFCAPGCKTDFDKNPAKYISGTASGSQSYRCNCV